MQTISQWERHLESPSSSHRMALGKLVEKPDLVAAFRATPEVALVMNPWGNRRSEDAPH